MGQPACFHREKIRWGRTGNSNLPLQGNTPTASSAYNFGSNQIYGRSYDAAGNQTNVNGDTLTYDAENRLTAATEPASLGGATEPFIYDALGQRTVREYPGNWVSYAYDAFGTKAATYNYWTSLNQEFIYLNGQLLATENNNNGSPCGTCYYTWDHLGSTRLVTDSSGNVVSRHDYQPFGEEIPGGWAGRSSQWGLNDGSRDKFTGQERDGETGLDYFNARYFAGALGRFTSPDPMNAGAVLTDPQSWNGYSYVKNSPLNAVDPTGKFLVDCSWDGCPSHGGGGGGGGVVIDGVEQTVYNTSGLGSNALAACPNNFCSGWTGNSQGGANYLQYGADANGQGAYTSLASAPPPGPDLAAISHTFSAISPYLPIGSGNFEVNYQERGNTFNEQIINPTTGLPFIFTDLYNLPSNTPDPLSGFHNGNSSIYVGNNALDVLHVVDVAKGYGVVRPGIDAHNDRFNPAANPLSFLAHQLLETIPFFFNPHGITGKVTCSVAQGCH